MTAAEHSGIFPCVFKAFVRRELRRHHHAPDLVGTQGVDRHGRRKRAVDAAGQVRAHRHVAPQLQLHGFLQQRVQMVDVVLARVVRVDLVVEIPVLHDRRLALAAGA
jgi:hypothetical protein